MNDEQYDQWCGEQNQIVTKYLLSQNLEHLGVADWPAFDVAPRFAIWAVQSLKAPGYVGWWAFSGDIPTDYVSVDPVERHPRKGLEDLLSTWETYLEHPNELAAKFSGHTDTELHSLLSDRVSLLRNWLQDGELWVYGDA